MPKSKRVFNLRYLLVAIIIFAIIFFTAALREDVPLVIIDPGHGGFNIHSKTLYGDKYNSLKLRYADSFKDGTSWKDKYESQEVYNIAKKTKYLLNLTLTQDGREKFNKILKKYTSHKLEKVHPIKALLSRPNDYDSVYEKIKDDPNAPYRLYDYPDVHTGKTLKGRLSKINDAKPSMVVSIHLNGGSNPKNGAIGSVITPSYRTFSRAINYVKGNWQQKKKVKKWFRSSPYKDWMNSCGHRPSFYQFLCDSWIYFTGYWSSRNGLSPNLKIFRGYRQNMLSWKYKDALGWENQALRHKWQSRYSRNLAKFTADGNFWKREKRKEEGYRREGGLETFGGDNHFAAKEILRYVRLGLLKNKVDSVKTLPPIHKPYISTWTMPTYINAISAYLEIGTLSSTKDYNRIKKHAIVYSEAIAVGIYSLYYGLALPKNYPKHDLPRGKSLDFKKYGSYFSEASSL